MSDYKLEKKIFYSQEDYANAIEIEDRKISVANDRIEELKKMLMEMDQPLEQTTQPIPPTAPNGRTMSRPTYVQEEQPQYYPEQAQYEQYQPEQTEYVLVEQQPIIVEEEQPKATKPKKAASSTTKKKKATTTKAKPKKAKSTAKKTTAKKPAAKKATTKTTTKSADNQPKSVWDLIVAARKQTPVKEPEKNHGPAKKVQPRKVVDARKTEEDEKIKNEIPVDKKHVIVTIPEFENYVDVDYRRELWADKAGHNETQIVCDFCKDNDNWATVKLEDGRDVCYYCWITRPENLTIGKKPIKKTALRTIPVAKSSVPKEPKNLPPRKHEAVETKLLQEYDYKKKLNIWRKSSGDNLTTQGCDKCGGKQYSRTILLKDGEHVCWYCWIRKPDELKKN